MADSLLQTDVCIYGAGLGGVAAALAVLEEGRRVVLIEPTPWIGGQMTNQGVSALDEHQYIEAHPGTQSYGLLRNEIRLRSARMHGITDIDRTSYNPGNGWVSRLCFMPQIAVDILDDWFAPWIAAGTCVILRETTLTAVERHNAKLSALICTAIAAGKVTCTAHAFVDASELGDLLEAAGCKTITGAESHADTGELWAPLHARPEEVQGFTYSFAVEYVPNSHNVIPKPEGYLHLRDAQPFTLVLTGSDNQPRPFRVFSEGETGLPPFWTYRRIRDGEQCHPQQTDIALINWNSNDYHSRTLIGANNVTYASIIDEAKRLSLSFLYYLQTEVPRDDGKGLGYPELRLRTDIMGTADGLSMAPYMRESRRTPGMVRITANDILAETQVAARARHWPDTIGIGWYPMDLHPAPGNPTSRYEPTRPFQIPLGALIPPDCSNLICANKNIATTHLSNGSYRLHPVEWSIGHAAGITLSVVLDHQTTLQTLWSDNQGVMEVQRRLVDRGTEIAWAVDVLPSGSLFVGTQWMLTHAVIDPRSPRGDALEVFADQPLTPVEYMNLCRAVSAAFGREWSDRIQPTSSWRTACETIQNALIEILW